MSGTHRLHVWYSQVTCLVLSNMWLLNRESLHEMYYHFREIHCCLEGLGAPWEQLVTCRKTVRMKALVKQNEMNEEIRKCSHKLYESKIDNKTKPV